MVDPRVPLVEDLRVPLVEDLQAQGQALVRGLDGDARRGAPVVQQVRALQA